ncbi:MAG: SIR2 family NAD-dependent protein deacylase [Steroidobacteraceae bacterium]
MRIPTELVNALQNAEHVVVLTGSGISAESGVPTFRDAQTGLWARFSPEEIATPEAFARDPALVWRWYRWRRELVESARPNAGHEALKELATLVARFTLITQNVDGLHQRAGSTDLIEFHGNIMRDRCSRGCGVSVPNRAALAPGDDQPPRCHACGAMLRPDVVWFGEAIPEAALIGAGAAVDACDVFMSVGTSSLVFPAAALAAEARRAGALIVEVNPNPTPLTPTADFALQAPAGAALPALVAALRA